MKTKYTKNEMHLLRVIAHLRACVYHLAQRLEHPETADGGDVFKWMRSDRQSGAGLELPGNRNEGTRERLKCARKATDWSK